MIGRQKEVANDPRAIAEKGDMVQPAREIGRAVWCHASHQLGWLIDCTGGKQNENCNAGEDDAHS